MLRLTCAVLLFMGVLNDSERADATKTIADNVSVVRRTDSQDNRGNLVIIDRGESSDEIETNKIIDQDRFRRLKKQKKKARKVKKSKKGVKSKKVEKLSKKNKSKYLNYSLRSFNSEIVDGYDTCSDYVSGLEEASKYMANAHIDRMVQQYYSTSKKSNNSKQGKNSSRRASSMCTITYNDVGMQENSYQTNNQVKGVDEADLVKSDGNYVYAAYGDNLVVWDAESGTELSRTIIAVDEEDYPLCEETDYRYPCYDKHYWQQVKIAGLLLHQNRIITIVQSPYILRSKDLSAFEEGKGTRIYIYDISSVPTDRSPLTLIARKDLNGYYQSARSINQYAHVVTSSSVNLWENLYQHLDPHNFVDEYDSYWDPCYNDFDTEKLSETEYRNAAIIKAEKLIPDFVQKLAFESLGSTNPLEEDCSSMVRLALYSKQNSMREEEESILTSFRTSNVLNNFVQVTSFDILDSRKVEGTISTHSSGVFIPLYPYAYEKSMYFSSEKLIIGGEGYEEDSNGNWKEKTLFFAFGLNEDKSKPESIGVVPGSLLNQFSMDHYKDSESGIDYLRVATTSRAQWALVDNEWIETEQSTSQVTVLNMMPLSNEMQIVGQVNDLGKDERIYAVRFMEDKAFVVTFRETDPFYTLDLKDPANPKLVGELKILGFSNYLHPIGEDGNTILAIGQNADENGVISGLQIAMFDVTDMANPVQKKKYLENSSTWSDAQYNHQAFRYLPETEVLILPLKQYTKPNFDGFVVYDVPLDPVSKIDVRFNIFHPLESYSLESSYWENEGLTPRSLVFDGNVMTMKYHTVMSHSLQTYRTLWELNLKLDE